MTSCLQPALHILQAKPSFFNYGVHHSIVGLLHQTQETGFFSLGGKCLGYKCIAKKQQMGPEQKFILVFFHLCFSWTFGNQASHLFFLWLFSKRWERRLVKVSLSTDIPTAESFSDYLAFAVNQPDFWSPEHAIPVGLLSILEDIDL